MGSGNDPLGALRDALRFSPDNVPLRRLAGTLLEMGQSTEACTVSTLSRILGL